MKKFFLILILLFVLVISSVFGILFTKTGNNLIANYIENRVNKEQNKVKLKVNNLDISLKNINFNATIDDNSNININGIFDIFKQNVDLKYDIKIKELSNLEALINKKLNGSFSTTGTFIGNKQSSFIKGISDLADSETTYDLELVDFELNNLKFLVKSAKIDKLLILLDKPAFAKGILNITGDIKNANIKSLDGNIKLNISKGKVDNKIFNKNFKQNLNTSINFKSDIKASLKTNTAIIKSETMTSLADLITEKLVFNFKSNKLKSDYKIDIKNLSKLETIVGKKLNGNFITSGDIEVEKEKIKVHGKSNIIDSNTSYNFEIKSSELSYLNFLIEKAKLDKLLNLLDEPVYAKGDIDFSAHIKNADLKKLDGKINTKINNGILINKVVNTVYKTKLKEKVTFKLESKNSLKNSSVISDANILTSLGDLNINESVFNIKNNSLQSNYTLTIPNLEKLYDIISIKMRGNLKVDGEFKNKDKVLTLNGNSNILGGKLSFLVQNNEVTAQVKDAKIKELTHMLYYPEIFESSSDLNLKYNLYDKKGILKGKLIKGHFLPNEFSMLINQFSKFDLTREIYDTVQINSDINEQTIKSVVNMKSKNTQIDITNSYIDLEKNFVEANLKSKIKNINLNAKIKGDIKSPKIKIDTKSLIQGEVKQKFDKKIDKVIEKNIKDEKTKEIIKGIKSLF